LSAAQLGTGRILRPLVGVPSGTSKTYRSLLLAVSSATINKPSEKILLTFFLSRSNAGLRGVWYQLSFSELVACWLFGTGLISLSEKPVPVEEQPAARTTIAESPKQSTTARRTRRFH
jgi:hypothetical protein